MKTLLLAALLCFAACSQAQDMDKELSALAAKLATSIKERGNKKVTVLDFTDLKGGASELGKYIAEQLTVELVMEKRDFSVLDRANLKSILAEHKLTATGLIDPENAKKLGQFAGVDALILGTIIPKNQNISLTAKIITTETAEVVGAARAEFQKDETVQELFQQGVKSTKSAASSTESTPSLGEQKFGNLVVTVDKLRKLPGDLYQEYQVDLSFQNTGGENPIAVAFYEGDGGVLPLPLKSTLVAGDGTELLSDTEDLSGIQSLGRDPRNLTEIEPGGILKASVKFQTGRPISPTVTTFMLRAQLVVNPKYDEKAYANLPLSYNLPPHCKIQTLNLELPAR